MRIFGPCGPDRNAWQEGMLALCAAGASGVVFAWVGPYHPLTLSGFALFLFGLLSMLGLLLLALWLLAHALGQADWEGVEWDRKRREREQWGCAEDDGVLCETEVSP